MLFIEEQTSQPYFSKKTNKNTWHELHENKLVTQNNVYESFANKEKASNVIVGENFCLFRNFFPDISG